MIGRSSIEYFPSSVSQHTLSLRKDEQLRNGELVWRDLNLCNDDGLTVDALTQPWLTKIKSPLADHGARISFYQMKTEAEWTSLANELLDQIDAAWPQATSFRGPQGTAISRQDALKGQP